MTLPVDTCLQCEQSRAEVKAKETICGIVEGYEYRELVAEWPRHHWRDWSDRTLAGIGIRPERYDEYRRASGMSLQYAACEDTVRGHIPATQESDYDDFGARVGQCIACGKKGAA
jgi:hypothetical protein